MFALSHQLIYIIRVTLEIFFNSFNRAIFATRQLHKCSFIFLAKKITIYSSKWTKSKLNLECPMHHHPKFSKYVHYSCNWLFKLMQLVACTLYCFVLLLIQLCFSSVTYIASRVQNPKQGLSSDDKIALQKIPDSTHTQEQMTSAMFLLASTVFDFLAIFSHVPNQ